MPMNAIRLRNWHFAPPAPQSGPMSKTERAFWLELIMQGSFLPPAGPKIDRIAYGADYREDEHQERSGTLVSRLLDR
jgi:hypothetical protein